MTRLGSKSRTAKALLKILENENTLYSIGKIRIKSKDNVMVSDVVRGDVVILIKSKGEFVLLSNTYSTIKSNGSCDNGMTGSLRNYPICKNKKYYVIRTNYRDVKDITVDIYARMAQFRDDVIAGKYDAYYANLRAKKRKRNVTKKIQKC